MITKYCKVCGEKIPEKRVQLGYKDTCVNHSTTTRFAALLSTNSESDCEISIVRDEETVKRIKELNNIYY